jgi:hypothetical protein
MIGKALVSVGLSLWTIMGSNAAWPQVVDWDQCLLTYLPSGRSSTAAGLVQSACSYLSLSASTVKWNRAERLYNECLLLNLGHVDSDDAAALVSQACYQRYRTGFRW